MFDKACVDSRIEKKNVIKKTDETIQNKIKNKTVLSAFVNDLYPNKIPIKTNGYKINGLDKQSINRIRYSLPFLKQYEIGYIW